MAGGTSEVDIVVEVALVSALKLSASLKTSDRAFKYIYALGGVGG
jgi:hypothetical protein